MPTDLQTLTTMINDDDDQRLMGWNDNDKGVKDWLMMITMDYDHSDQDWLMMITMNDDHSDNEDSWWWWWWWEGGREDELMVVEPSLFLTIELSYSLPWRSWRIKVGLWVSAMPICIHSSTYPRSYLRRDDQVVDPETERTKCPW